MICILLDTPANVVRVPVSSLDLLDTWRSLSARRKKGHFDIIINGMVVAKKRFTQPGDLMLSAPIHIGAPEQWMSEALSGIKGGFSGCLKKVAFSFLFAFLPSSFIG